MSIYTDLNSSGREISVEHHPEVVFHNVNYVKQLLLAGVTRQKPVQVLPNN